LGKRESGIARLRDALRDVREGEAELLTTRDRILRRAWDAGRELADIRATLPRGMWQRWLLENVTELGPAPETILRNASRFLGFFKCNAGDRRNPPIAFNPESVRKAMWRYVPAKERLALKGDVRLRPVHTHLKFVNEFCRWRRRVRNGHTTPPTREQLRLELAPVLQEMAELLGKDWLREQID
jgi:hypothetical protein